MAVAEGKIQINPQIRVDLYDEIVAISRRYDADKYWILAVLLQYGARHWKAAMDEFHELAKADGTDSDDAIGNNASKIHKLPAQR